MDSNPYGRSKRMNLSVQPNSLSMMYYSVVIMNKFFRSSLSIKYWVLFFVFILTLTPSHQNFIDKDNRNNMFSWAMFSKISNHENYVLRYSNTNLHLNRHELINKYATTNWFLPYGLGPLKKICSKDAKLNQIQREGRFPDLFNCSTNFIGDK